MADQRADIEHRIRTELTTISLAGQILQRAALEGSRQRRLGTEIVRACNHVQACLEELLDSPPGSV